MQAFAGILFQVDAVQLNIFFSARGPDMYEPAFTDRRRVLGYLVSFGKIRIEIVLTGKIIISLYLAVTGQTHFYGKLNGRPVQLGQRAGKTQGHRAHMRIGIPPKGCTVPAEQLCPGKQLGMNFQTYDHLVCIKITHNIICLFNGVREYCVFVDMSGKFTIFRGISPLI